MTRKTKVSVGLSILASIGVGVTALLAGKETAKRQPVDPNLSKKDKAIIFVKDYKFTLLSALVTEACICGAQVLDLQEITMLTGAAGYFASKYKQLDEKVKELYPEEYEEVKQSINEDDAKAAAEKYKVEGTYDGKTRYYFPFLDQIVYMFPDDIPKIQWFISARLGSDGVCTLNELADYIHHDLGYKDVHLVREEKYWELSPYGDREVTQYDFPILIPDGYDDILDDNGQELPCKIMTFDNEDLPKKVLNNRYS